jgi:hypothetical protein
MEGNKIKRNPIVPRKGRDRNTLKNSTCEACATTPTEANRCTRLEGGWILGTHRSVVNDP